MLFIKKGSIFLIDPENGEMFHPGRIRGKRHREQKTGHTLWGTAVLLYPAASAGFGVGGLRAALPVNPAAACRPGEKCIAGRCPHRRAGVPGNIPSERFFQSCPCPTRQHHVTTEKRNSSAGVFLPPQNRGRDSFPLISYALTSRKEETKRSGLFLHVSIRHSIVQRAGPG